MELTDYWGEEDFEDKCYRAYYGMRYADAATVSLKRMSL
jgi:hypothetical protein